MTDSIVASYRHGLLPVRSRTLQVDARELIAEVLAGIGRLVAGDRLGRAIG